MTGRERRTLDQRRARHAWDSVSAAAEALRGNGRTDYAREAKRLPVRIRTAGLGHSIAFLRAKSKSNDGPNERLLSALDAWVLRHRRLPGTPAKAACLSEAIVHGDATFLQMATEEALAWLMWLTRFAEAEFGSGDE